MEPYIIVYLIPLTLFASLIYFILIRQNSFEKRVAQYIPRHRLPQKRQVHIQQQKRQLKQYRLMFPLIGVGMILYFGYLHYSDEGTLTLSPLLISNVIFAACFTFLMSYLFIGITKRNIKAQQMLLETMSDTDYNLYLKIVKEQPSYLPQVMVCQEKLYFILNYSLKEFELSKIIWASLDKDRGLFFKLSVIQGEEKDGVIKQQRSGSVTLPKQVGQMLKNLIDSYRFPSYYDDDNQR